MNRFALRSLLEKSRDPEGAAAAFAYDVPGHGEEARAFVQRLMGQATGVRFERDSLKDSRTGKYGRALEYAILSTPQGEINVNEELIRAGYSRYLEDFGVSQRFGERFAAAEAEAKQANRGMWGGKSSAIQPTYYDPSPTTPYATRAFDLSAVDVIDADTFGLGISAPARLYNVNAPEMGAYHQRSNQLHHSVYESLVSQILMRANGRGMWSGIRQPFPTNPGQFEAMKPGRPGFPGGREQKYATYAMDTETQGLWSRSYFVDPNTGQIGRAGRSVEEPLQIAEVYLRRLRKSGKRAFKMHAWIDDAISNEALQRANIGPGDIRAIKNGTSAKLGSLWDLVAPRQGQWGEASEVGRWDPSVRIHDTVVNKTARRLVVRKLKQAAGQSKIGLKSAKQAYGKILSEWEKKAKITGGKITGKRIRVAAWNASYDVSVMIHNMRQVGLGDRIDTLIEADALRVKDLMDPLHEMRLRAMIADPNYRPTITNRQALNKAWATLRRDLTDDEIRRLGGTEEHVALREFADDVAKGKDAFLSRGTKWAQLQANQEAAGKQVQRLVQRLEKVKDYRSLRRLVSTLRRQAMVRGPERRGALDVLNEWYQVSVKPGGSAFMDRSKRHIKIFGDLQSLERAQVGARSPLHSIGLPTQFVPGGRLEEMAELLIKNRENLRVDPKSVEFYSKFVGSTKAHTTISDTEVAVRLHKDMRAILADERAAGEFQRIITARENVQAWGIRGARRHLSDLMASHEVHGPAAAEMAERTSGFFSGVKDSLKNLFQKHSGKAAIGFAAGAMALWWLSNRTADRPEEQSADDWVYEENSIQGLRSPVTPWNTTWGGIGPSPMPFANVSSFGSGRDDSKAPGPAPATPGTHTYLQPALNDLAAKLSAAGSGARTEALADRPVAGHAVAGHMATPVWSPAFPDSPSRPPTAVQAGLGRPIELPGHPEVPDALQTVLQAPEPTGGQASDPPEPPVDLGRAKHIPRGYSGFVTRYLGSPEYMSQSKVRDQATQLHRLPGVPRTFRGRLAGAVSHYERVGGESSL